MKSRKLVLSDSQEARALAGPHDEHLRLIEKELGMVVAARGNEIILKGTEKSMVKADRLIGELRQVLARGEPVRTHSVRTALRALAEGKPEEVRKVLGERIEVSSKRQYVKPMTVGQRHYVEAIRKYDIVLGIGPAGTGKTYLAMAMAVEALQKKQVSRIILTRPALEAGEKLGYLPGDIYEKVLPYLRPLYDALYDMVDAASIQRYIDRGVIEVAPLAFMRGRTLNDSFVILDEAQNSTSEQMKMFLTRLGFDSKTVVTGDITQIDLPEEKRSGLTEVQSILSGIKGIKFVYLTGKDVVRHELVQKIIKAYAASDRKREEG